MIKMNILKRGLIFMTFFGCCLSVALLAAALGTKYWFQADAKQKDLMHNSSEYRKDASGHINFGLIKGDKLLNWGIGDRLESFEVSNLSVVNTPLWIATIAAVSLAILAAVVGAIFAVINTATTPIEQINGVFGLYIWNGVAAFLCLTGVTIWAVHFHLYLCKNILVDLEKEGWTTHPFEFFGYSFWLVIIAAATHVTNCVIIHVASHEQKPKTKFEPPESKAGNLMLY